MDKVRFVLGRDRQRVPGAVQDSRNRAASPAPGQPAPGPTPRDCFERSAREIARAVEDSPGGGLAASGRLSGGEDVPFGLRRRLGAARVGPDPAPGNPADSDAALAARIEQLRRSIAAVAFDFVTQVVDLSSALMGGAQPSQPRTRPCGDGQLAAASKPETPTGRR